MLKKIHEVIEDPSDRITWLLKKPSTIAVSPFPYGFLSRSNGRSKATYGNRYYLFYCPAHEGPLLNMEWDFDRKHRKLFRAHSETEAIQQGGILLLNMYLVGKHGTLHLDSFAGRSASQVEIIRVNPKTYRVKLLEDCMKGKKHAILNVPKDAVSINALAK